MSGADATPGLTCDEVREMAGAFVLGALAPADEAAARAHLPSCTDAHAEIWELGGVLPAIGASAPTVEPPAGLKARIMAAAAADLAARDTATAIEPAAPGVAGARPGSAAPGSTAPDSATPAAAAPGPAAATPIAFPSATEREARRARTSAAGWVVRIAAVVAIVALAGWNLLLQGQLNAAQAYEQSVADVLQVASQPGSLTAILTPDGGAGSGLAAVSASGDVTMAMLDLAPTNGNAVYEAWVIGGDKVAVPLGSFKVGSSGTASFHASGLPTASGIVLALTLEPGPGATAPTPPVITKGVATAAG